MGVIMQTFYWDCPRLEAREYQWWAFLKPRLAQLSATGFTAIWLPPFQKAANIGGPSMGYDPYDYWDLGEFDQKGSIPTWFGTKDQLIALLTEANAQNIDVYADLVINHNSGADAQELNPITNTQGWTKFTPASGRFPRTWESFHPSLYETTDGLSFGDMPDLCHRNPDVYTALLEYARDLIEQHGIKGFRYDMVKGYGGWMVRAIQELRGLQNDLVYRPFGVGECWDTDRTILDWLTETNAWSDNPCAAFDFPLREFLRGLCDDFGFSLKTLAPTPNTSGPAGTILAYNAALSVTFVENHDIIRDNPIGNDKLLAYAYILTHEGYPCVFWQDYYNGNLAQPGEPTGIDALVKAHESNAGGPTEVLHVDDDLYIMQRTGTPTGTATGTPTQHGLLFVLNNTAAWNGASVKTHWPDSFFQPVAWYGHDNTDIPEPKSTGDDGVSDFWAPPRGYTIYLPR
ncbi:alpha-amylase family glycosyl hydrolase [Puia sp.]|uniref:alpha-amylase family glycosyl hydrolase n=1 Tax=Puia sp. TaxID=2045100 RepID=UPI002F4205F1